MNDDQRTRFSDALARLDGDEETLVMLAGMVAEDAPSLVTQLHTEIQSSELSDAAGSGHALKGLLSTFETGTPVSEIQPLIDAARRSDCKAATLIFTEIRTSLETLIDEIQGISKSS
jgi:hypothetical protein